MRLKAHDGWAGRLEIVRILVRMRCEPRVWWRLVPAASSGTRNSTGVEYERLEQGLIEIGANKIGRRAAHRCGYGELKAFSVLLVISSA